MMPHLKQRRAGLLLSVLLASSAVAQQIRTEDDGTIVITESGISSSVTLKPITVTLGPKTKKANPTPISPAPTTVTVGASSRSVSPVQMAKESSIPAPTLVVATPTPKTAESAVKVDAEAKTPAKSEAKPEVQAAVIPTRLLAKNIMGTPGTTPPQFLNVRFFAIPGENGKMRLGYNILNTSSATVMVTDVQTLKIKQGVRIVNARLNSTNSSGQAGFLGPRSGEYGTIELDGVSAGSLELSWVIKGGNGEDATIEQRWDIQELPKVVANNPKQRLDELKAQGK